MNFIPTDRFNNGNRMYSFYISPTSQDGLKNLGCFSVCSTFRKLGNDKYIDQDVAFFLLQNLLKRDVESFGLYELRSYTHLVKELENIRLDAQKVA